jgi:arylsulfatase A-like enzyme
LVTGKHPGRTRNTQYFGGAAGGTPYVDTLSAAEVTVGEAFQMAGYATAHLGKWHLGSRLLPPSHGFDLNLAGTGAGHPASYFSPYQNARLPDGPSGEYLTDRLSDGAVAFIEANRARPFCLLLAHYAPHTPLQAKAGLVAKYQAKAAGLDSTGPRFGTEGANQVRLVQDHATYAAMIESVDQGVAKIMAGLRRLGLDSNTAVIVTSDNGGLSTSGGHPPSNVPLRAGKGWLYEGGIRVPFIARWSGRFAAGKVTDSTATTTDLYPTLLQLAGLATRVSDGDRISLVPAIAGGGLEQARLARIRQRIPEVQPEEVKGGLGPGVVEALSPSTALR